MHSESKNPDPLQMVDGALVTSGKDWMERRAPELRALFQKFMYGRMPKGISVRASRFRTDPAVFDGEAILHDMDLDCGLTSLVRLLLFLPKSAKGPVPCFLGLNFGGNHTVTNDPAVRLPEGFVRPKFGTADGRADKDKRGSRLEDWAVEESLRRGYAVAIFFSGDVVPDDPELAAGRLQELCPDQKDGAATGTIMAWAWGLLRGIDYLSACPEIDSQRIAVVGHSRHGKAALLATAFDPRIAMVIASQSGCGGAAPSRVPRELAQAGPDGRPQVETIRAINESFPHWFCPNFHRFNESPEKLPFEQDALIALCAPRPVLLSNAEDDNWAYPNGQFTMLKGADPVYRLVAGSGLDVSIMPTPGKCIDGRLGYFLRQGYHSVTAEDWAAWHEFGKRWL